MWGRSGIIHYYNFQLSNFNYQLISNYIKFNMGGNNYDLEERTAKFDN